MSTGSYIRNPTVTYYVKCVYILGGKAHVNVRVSTALSEEDAIRETNEMHLWAKHPSFMCGIVGRTVC